MALSQVQCLDDHNVNWRVSESKPEFFYSEDQRRAVEALIAKGRDAFMDYIRESGVREFLSEQELERIAHSAEAYRPGHEHHQPPDTPGNLTPGSHEEAGDGEVSLEYWPDRSEVSVAELDLGWPDAASYRGVTRVTVHTQPPADGSTHIKEVVRKSIALAQKMIAVVMDVFTDVDIFRDLMDAAYKRKIAVYIILDTAAVPCFLSMCGRADMHRGHIKNMRVRCCGGVEFFARSAKKVHGKLSQKFLLVDGDRAISGSYSFTWSSSRLDRNLITVITGQAVETFDLQFRELFLTSRGVSLNKVPMVDEPIPDVVPQAAPVPVSAAVARKLINPKYALVATGNYTSPNSSADNSVKKNPNGLRIPLPRLRRVVEEPAVHPALANMEKAYLIPYLPTWPEPDPPKDVIGFINIRDDKRAHQVHLQRSERFETSQAIRFSTPLTQPAQTENPAVGKEANAAVRTENPPGNTSTDAPTPTPVNPTDKQQTHTAPKIDQTDATDSGEPPEQPNTPVAQERPKPNAHTPTSTSNVTADSESTDNVKETPQETPQTVAPPVPKRRTLQLVIDPAPSEQPGVQPHVTLMKMDQSESVDDSEITEEELPPDLGLTTSKDDGGDSGSNDDDDGSLDSTKVLCDRAANEDPSSASTASEEEFYDGSQQEARDPLTNGVTTGSGRGHRHGDGVNMMARLSQSMLDLREPKSSEDSANLIRQSQQLRRKDHPSPHRHIGQLFQTSKPSGHDSRLTGAKVVIAKPGSHHRPTRSTGPVIGGHRYWQGQTLHPDSAQQRSDARSSRSPRRHSPGYKKTDQSGPQPPTNSVGLLGVSFSKLSNLRHLRARGGSSQKKTPQNNKAAR